MSIEKFKPSYDIFKNLLEKLKLVVPQAFEDGKVNFDLLKESFGSFVDEENPEKEHYSFIWPGKGKARRLAGKPPQGCLVPMSEEGVNEDKTENVIIEGDNLEVLKLLQKSYAGKIKVIYIDPPYNTGHDFIYNDNFETPLEEYLKLTGQIGEQGAALVSNKKADGRFHSKWLNMMYPRLYLAKNLIKEDGLIFISIDDNEVDNLRKICSEIFGEENFIAQFIWVKKKKGSHLSETHRSMTEYILCFTKQPEDILLYGEKAYDDKWQPLVKRTNSEKELCFPKEKVKTKLDDGFYKNGIYSEETISIEFLENFTIKDGIVVTPLRVKGPFVWTQSNLDHELGLGTEVSLSKKYGLNIFKHDQLTKFKTPSTLLDTDAGIGTNEDASEEVLNLLGQRGIVSYPKPVSLLEYLINSNTYLDDEGIVLDFFAGSGTTAEAVLTLNKKDGKNRKFIKLARKPQAFKPGDEWLPGGPTGFLSGRRP